MNEILVSLPVTKIFSSTRLVVTSIGEVLDQLEEDLSRALLDDDCIGAESTLRFESGQHELWGETATVTIHAAKMPR